MASHVFVSVCVVECVTVLDTLRETVLDTLCGERAKGKCECTRVVGSAAQGRSHLVLKLKPKKLKPIEIECVTDLDHECVTLLVSVVMIPSLSFCEICPPPPTEATSSQRPSAGAHSGLRT